MIGPPNDPPHIPLVAPLSGRNRPPLNLTGIGALATIFLPLSAVVPQIGVTP